MQAAGAHDPLVGIASVIALGIAAQWLAGWLRLPSILLLLVCGFVAGPITGWLDPDALFGPLLLSVVSLSVALILFEGALSLRFAELREVGGVLRNLLSVGVVVTWAIATGAAQVILGLELEIALLLGAILVVTGPTVIGPLLRHVRPAGAVGPILRWEGIVIDPIGASFAVLVFEAILVDPAGELTTTIARGMALTLAAGALLGAAGAALLVLALRMRWVPDALQNPVAVALALAVFAAANQIQPDSGLLAATLMGVALANQKRVSVRHLTEFPENLRVLLLGGLFVALGARLEVDAVLGVAPAGLLFLAALVLVARPAAVFASALGSRLSWRERLFVAGVAPRGIVAAAVSSVFALRLAEVGVAGAELLVPVTFVVIIGTVALYGLGAGPLARALGVAQADPQGVLIVGAHAWARDLARALQERGVTVLLVDTNAALVAAARRAGLPAWRGNVLDEQAEEELDLGGIGKLLALTSNDAVNSLAALHYAEIFGRDHVYQLAPRDAASVAPHLLGRLAFGRSATHDRLAGLFARGGRIEVADERASREEPAEAGAESELPLFAVGAGGRLSIATDDVPLTPSPGQSRLVLAPSPAKVSASS